MSESNKTVEVPMRKEQEMIYRNNENTERLTVEKKDIYDEKDVMKPMSHYTHQPHEPSSQQRHKQEEDIEELQEQKERTNCDMNKYHKEKINERNRNREEEIANRNREHASNDESTEEKTPADDEENEAPTNVLNRYRYIFNERVPEAKESINVDLRSQIPNMENWSSRMYQSQSQAEQSSPVLVQLQNMRSSHQNLQSRPSNSRYSRSARRPKNRQPKDQGKNDGKMKSLQPIPTNKSENQREDDGRMEILQLVSTSKPFDDPQSAHDFFGFNKDDYSFAGESSDALKVEENGKIMKESDMPLDLVVYHHDNESVTKHADEPENDTEKAKVTEYRNKVTTLKISEQRQLTPNGPIHYVNFIRNI